ncbi:uncharacterized protein LOC110431582, partial [Sorghum bicolor]
MVAVEEKKEREAALAKARETSKKAEEEGRAVAELDKEKSLLKSELASAREAYRELKEECVKSEIARSAAEEAGKKAREDLEAERIRSRSLSDDVDRLKIMLLEKEGAILQAGKMIEDLQVENSDLARSYKEIERANTDLVGENTALEERIRGLKDDLLATQVDARSTKVQLEGE